MDEITEPEQVRHSKNPLFIAAILIVALVVLGLAFYQLRSEEHLIPGVP